jgi:hypothetical protein
MLTSLLIHVILILDWYLSLIQNLSKLHEMFIDSGTIEALGSFGIKTQGFPKTQIWVPFEESSISVSGQLPAKKLRNSI